MHYLLYKINFAVIVTNVIVFWAAAIITPKVATLVTEFIAAPAGDMIASFTPFNPVFAHLTLFCFHFVLQHVDHDIITLLISGFLENSTRYTFVHWDLTIQTVLLLAVRASKSEVLFDESEAAPSCQAPRHIRHRVNSP